MSVRDKAIEAMARAMCVNPDRCVHGSGWVDSAGNGGTKCDLYEWQTKVPHAAMSFDVAIKALMEPSIEVIDAAVWDHQKGDIALARGAAFAIWTDMLKEASQ